METIGRPWLFEPDADALVELMKRVVNDRDGARAIGMAASDHIREHFTWARTVEAVEQRLWALSPGPLRTLTRSASEGLYRPFAKSSPPPTRSASEGLYRPFAKSSPPPTRSASEGLYRPFAKSSPPPTQSASEGLYRPSAESSGPPTQSASFDVALLSSPKRGIHKSAQGIALGANPAITRVPALKGPKSPPGPGPIQSSDGFFTSITTSLVAFDCLALSGLAVG